MAATIIVVLAGVISITVDAITVVALEDSVLVAGFGQFYYCYSSDGAASDGAALEDLGSSSSYWIKNEN